MYRQGDILLLPYSGSPRTKALDTNVIASSDSTSHSHKVVGDAVLHNIFGGPIILVVGDQGCQVTHEEHNPISIPTGKYEIRHQREALTGDGSEERQVYD